MQESSFHSGRNEIIHEEKQTKMNNNKYDDDDNEKHSKIQRTSKVYMKRAVFFFAGLTVFALALGHHHTHDPPQLSIDIKTMIDAHEVKKNELKLKRREEQQTKITDEDEKIGKEEEEGEQDDDRKEDEEQDDDRKQEQKAGEPQRSFEEIDDELAATVDSIDEMVRARKHTKGVIMETDAEGLKLTTSLQKETTKLLEHRYGANTRSSKFRVVVDLLFPDSIVKDPDASHEGRFVIEMAPIDLVPCSVFYFLEIARTYKGGSFHRNANHVLQAAAQSGATSGHKSMPFQEYSPKHPHKKYTAGYAGRPSGPGWYVSIQDNTANHGPGSQQHDNPYEADANFGEIVEGVENGVIAKIHSVPQMGWLSAENCVKIVKLTIMANSMSDPDIWTEWRMPSSS
mmetsp:Transcript_14328/g.29702  ORF Transcript_14328/g.29702 Transcript_14328/m.29702 type:complete len:399 (+) Transcript_14328:62-1258(+)